MKLYSLIGIPNMGDMVYRKVEDVMSFLRGTKPRDWPEKIVVSDTDSETARTIETKNLIDWSLIDPTWEEK